MYTIRTTGIGREAKDRLRRALTRSIRPIVHVERQINVGSQWRRLHWAISDAGILTWDLSDVA